MILVVDDHEDTRQLLAKILHIDGFAVTTAGSSLEALDYLDKNPVSCLVVDYLMPRVDGVALATMVRQNMRWRHVRIVLFSSFDAELPQSVNRIGIDAIIIKARQPWAAIVKELEQQCRLAEPGTKFLAQLNERQHRPDHPTS